MAGFDLSTAVPVESDTPGGFDLSTAKPDTDVPTNPQLRALRYKNQANPPLDPSNIDPVVAGSLIGGAVGAMTPFPGGAFAGSEALGGLIGTVAGTSIGTSTKQLNEQRKGNVGTLRDTLGEQAQNVAEQSLYQLAGNVIGSGVAKTLNAAAPAVREGAAKAQDILRQYGGSLSAAQVGHSSVIELAESLARSGMGGKGKFLELDKKNADALQAIKDDLIKKISSAPVDDSTAGQIFLDTISKGNAAHAVASQALYKTFDSRVGNVSVDATPIKQFGEELAARFERIGNVGKSEAGGRLIDQLKSIPDTMTFSDAQALRSNLMAQVRDLETKGGETKALATARRAASVTDDAMTTSASNLPPDLLQQFRQINAFYKEGKGAFNNDVIGTLVKQNPERVGETLFRSGNVSEIVQARKSLEYAAKMDPTINKDAVFGRLQASYLNTLLTSKAATNLEGDTTAQNLMKTLAEGKTNRQFEVMFTPQQIEAISDFGRTAFLALRNKPSQFGVLAPLLQAKAVGDIVLANSGYDYPGHNNMTTSIGFLGAPYVLAAVLTNPRAVRVLAGGLKLSTEGSLSAPVLTKLTAELVKSLTPKGSQAATPTQSEAPAVPVPFNSNRNPNADRGPGMTGPRG